jgi:hypothetical protein
MLETLHPVEILISDLHVRPGGVADPDAAFRPGFGFLGDAAAYAARYAVKAPIEGAPELRPMGRRRLTRWNRFWAAYRHLNPFSQSPWLLFLPLVWEDPKLEVRLVVPELGVDLPVTVKALVWPTGWSTSLEVRMDGEVSRETALALAGVLRAGKEQAPFAAGGKTGAASMVFQLVGGRIASRLLQDADTSPTVSARYVVAVADASRKAAQYTALELPERQAVHQLLLGKAPAAQQAALKNEGVRVNFDVADFGIIHPDHGAVLCLTSMSASSAFVDEGFHCLAANARTAWVQMPMLAHFAEQAADHADDPRVGPLLKSARTILRQAQKGASHLFTRELCKVHPVVVSAAKGPAGPEAEAA